MQNPGPAQPSSQWPWNSSSQSCLCQGKEGSLPGFGMVAQGCHQEFLTKESSRIPGGTEAPSRVGSTPTGNADRMVASVPCPSDTHPSIPGSKAGNHSGNSGTMAAVVPCPSKTHLFQGTKLGSPGGHPPLFQLSSPHPCLAVEASLLSSAPTRLIGVIKNWLRVLAWAAGTNGAVLTAGAAGAAGAPAPSAALGLGWGWLRAGGAVCFARPDTGVTCRRGR